MENKKLTWKHYLGIAVVAVLVIYLVIGFSFSNKFFWGTKINGMNVAGKTADQVIEMFDKKANDYSLTIKERKDKTETLTSDQLRTKFEGADEIKQIKEDQGSFGWIKGLFGSEHYDTHGLFAGRKYLLGKSKLFNDTKGQSLLAVSNNAVAEASVTSDARLPVILNRI